MAETFTVRLPNGQTITRQLPDGATDAQVRAAFRGEMKKHGLTVEQQQIQRPSNEDYWLEKLGDQGEISKPDFDLGETLEGTLGDVLAKALSERDARRLAGKTFNAVNDLTPVGDVVGAQRGGSEIYHGLTQGDLGQMALGAGSFALSVLPGNAAVQRKGEGWLRALLGDESGAIRAYHGGPAFEGDFDISKAGSGIGHPNEQAVWFTPDAEEANRYAWNVGEPGYGGKAVYPATIDDTDFGVVHPLRYDNEAFVRWLDDAREAGLKGVVFKSVREDARINPADQIAVLDPSRIQYGR